MIVCFFGDYVKHYLMFVVLKKYPVKYSLMKKISGLLFLLSLLFVSCASTKTERFVVASKQGDCIGVAPQKCLLVKKETDENWKFFYGQIEGFTYQEGYEYLLDVKTEKRENVPADASSLRCILVKEVSKISKNSEGLPESVVSSYQWVGKVLEISNSDIRRGAVKGKMNSTVLKIHVTSSEADKIKAGDTIYCELAASPKVEAVVGGEYVFKAKYIHPAHALGVYMLETNIQDLTK